MIPANHRACYARGLQIGLRADEKPGPLGNAVADFYSLFFAFREKSEFVSHTSISVLNRRPLPWVARAAPWADVGPSRWD